MLVDQIEGQHKPRAVTFSDQGSLQTLHDSGLDANSLAKHKFAIGFNEFLAYGRTQEFYLGIRKGRALCLFANNLQNTWRLENNISLPGLDMYKQIAREKGENNSFPLPVSPNADRLIGWTKRLDVSQRKMFCRRLFILRNGEDRMPFTIMRRSGEGHRLRRLIIGRLTYRFAIHSGPVVRSLFL